MSWKRNFPVLAIQAQGSPITKARLEDEGQQNLEVGDPRVAGYLQQLPVG